MKKVQAEDCSGSEAILRVSNPSKSIAYKVTLWTEEEDWNCDCGSKFDPCEHVVASAIALKQSKEKGVELPRFSFSKPHAEIYYFLTRTPDGISFDRYLKCDDSLVPLKKSLTLLSSGRGDVMVTPSSTDLSIEFALDTQKRGVFSLLKWKKIIPHLAKIENIFLDHKKIKVNPKPVGVIGYVFDEGSGVLIKGEQDKSIRETFKNQLALCGDSLREISNGGLTQSEWRMLKEGQYFGLGELERLVSEVIPALRKKIRLEVRSKNLPKDSNDIKPRVVLETHRVGDSLKVTPVIVYGEDPVVAKVVANRLVVTPGMVVPERNKFLEKKYLSRALQTLGLKPNESALFEKDKGVVFAEKLGSWKGHIIGDGYVQFQKVSPLHVDFSIENEGFNLSFSSKGNKNLKADAMRVVQAWKENESLVPLLDGGWAPLPSDWLDKYGAKIFDLLQAKKDHDSLPKSFMPELVDLANDMGIEINPELSDYQNLLEGVTTLASTHLDLEVQAELRNYQTEGVKWLSFLKKKGLGALLADDMGLGKTLQAICVMEPKTLVIAPTSVLHNWKREIEKFRPSLSCSVYHGSNRRLDKDADVIVTTYALLRNDLEKLNDKAWNMVVLDEAQNIKNASSQVAKAAYELRADFRLSLSGTPIENSLDDLWSHFRFLNPGLLSDKGQFQKNYVQPILKGFEESTEQLRRKIRPFVLRRLKEEVLPELPSRTEVVLECELSEVERTSYDSILVSTRKEVLEKFNQNGNVMEALETLLRLRQAASFSGMLPGSEAVTSSKIQLLLEELKVILAAGHKALIFSQWTSFLTAIEFNLEKEGMEPLRLDGSTKNRQEICDQFQEKAHHNILLMSLKAGGTGLNLTAADHVFMMDPWWNPAAEDQARDRAYRIGQKNPVLVQKIIAKNTVEEHILELQMQKRKIAEASITEGSFVESLSKNEIVELLLKA